MGRITIEKEKEINFCEKMNIIQIVFLCLCTILFMLLALKPATAMKHISNKIYSTSKIYGNISRILNNIMTNSSSSNLKRYLMAKVSITGNDIMDIF